jgi:trehalose/maltose hydrolase-like predicted phosphorylase
VIRISSDTWEASSATVLQMSQGLVRRIQCFKFISGRSAFATHVLYAHRKRSSLIIQDIEIINPSEYALDLDVQINKRINENEFKQLDQDDIQFESTKEIYQMTTNQISARQHNVILFVIITNKILSNIHMKPSRYVFKIQSTLISRL